MTATKTWSRDMGRLAIDPDQAGLVAGYDMVPDGVTLEDKSGNGNHGTISGAAFEFTEIGPSMKFDGVADYVEIADDPSLDITDDLTLSAWVKTTDSDGGNIISKWVTSGNQRSFSMVLNAGGELGFYVSSDGAINEREDSGVLVNDGLTHQLACVYKKALNSVDFYIDGVFIVTKIYTISVGGIFNSTANIRLGDEQSGSIFDFLTGNIMCPKMITRALTPAEIQAEYQAGAQAINWKSDYGVSESVAAEATPGELSNSPARIISGTHKIATDTINGCSAKVVECVTAGVVAIPTAYFHGDDTQAAHGTFEFWMNKLGAGTDLIVSFISSDDSAPGDASSNGYFASFTSSQRIQVIKHTGASLAAITTTPISYTTVNAWHKLKITRSSNGEFTTYLDGILVDVTGGGGSNPAIDTTFTTSKYIILDLDAGDKVAWATKNGDCAITKYQGVV